MIPWRSKLIFWFLVVLLATGAAQLGCALTSREEATPSPGPTAQVTATGGPTQPTATVRPTQPILSPTPLPPLPPQVVLRSPTRGEEARTDASLMIRYDQPMEKGSVEQAFSISPDISGSFEWADDRTMLFWPANGFERQTRYDVTISDVAHSAAGLAAELPYSFRFQTVGFLEVSQTLPADGDRGG